MVEVVRTEGYVCTVGHPALRVAYHTRHNPRAFEPQGRRGDFPIARDRSGGTCHINQGAAQSEHPRRDGADGQTVEADLAVEVGLLWLTTADRIAAFEDPDIEARQRYARRAKHRELRRSQSRQDDGDVDNLTRHIHQGHRRAGPQTIAAARNHSLRRFDLDRHPGNLEKSASGRQDPSIANRDHDAFGP